MCGTSRLGVQIPLLMFVCFFFNGLYLTRIIIQRHNRKLALCSKRLLHMCLRKRAVVTLVANGHVNSGKMTNFQLDCLHSHCFCGTESSFLWGFLFTVKKMMKSSECFLT